MADKHQQGEIYVSNQRQSFVAGSELSMEDVENTPSQAPRKKRIALDAKAVAAVSS